MDTQLQNVDARLQATGHGVSGLASDMTEVLQILGQPSQSISRCSDLFMAVPGPGFLS
jgi:hypothetical protein